MATNEAKREANRARYRKRRAEMIEFLGGSCVVCGSVIDLEIHHRNPAEKTFDVSERHASPWPVLEAELMKCELRCRTHHHAEHATAHGRWRMYILGCRCDACVMANREASRRHMPVYRAKKKGTTRDLRRVPLEFIEECQRLRREGFGYAEIGRRVSRSGTSVKALLLRYAT